MKIRDPRIAWKSQPTYLISEMTFLTIGLLTFIHCKHKSSLFYFFNFFFSPSPIVFLNCCYFAIHQPGEWAVVLNISGWLPSFTASSSNALPTGYRILIIFGTRKRQSSYSEGDCLCTSSCSVPYISPSFTLSRIFCK